MANVSKSKEQAPRQILIVDDIPAFCRELKRMLPREIYTSTICTDPVAVTGMLLKRKFDLVITTLVMKKMGGFDLIRKIRGSGIDVPIMLITGYGSLESAIEAQRIGVSDYLYKPVSEKELNARVAKVLDKARLEQEHGATFRLDNLVSQDPAMKSIFDMVEAVALSNSRVLILGETGTGKQLIAQAIHSHSPRKDEPFVEINCAAIPEALLESEFFGHERGAFTGSVAQRKGRFEEAQGGTLFLDEIGEISYDLQAKLLRVLQDGSYSRVGGNAVLKSKARVIAATNRDVRKLAQEGSFRTDLFYRLHVISLTIPPLRKRKKDLPFLTRYFLDKYCPAGREMAFSPTALTMMESYSWPGNVRELEHLVERFSVMHPHPIVEAEDLPDYIQQAAMPVKETSVTAPLPFREARQRFEREYIAQALRLHNGNMSRAARYAGMDRSQFFRMVRHHGMNPKEPQFSEGINH